jgi:hypothetical protein
MNASSEHVFNFIAYQLAWFACVLGAAHDFAWAGTAFALAVTAVHLALRRDAVELRLIVCAALIGFIADSVLVRTHFVEFESTNWSGFAPLWMVSLWMVFATTLNHSLRWLASRPPVAALAGAIGGPLAYLGGAKLGALTIAMPNPALILIAFLWALALGLLSLLGRERNEAVDRRIPA